jgi:hypothetical protein
MVKGGEQQQGRDGGEVKLISCIPTSLGNEENGAKL